MGFERVKWSFTYVHAFSWVGWLEWWAHANNHSPSIKMGHNTFSWGQTQFGDQPVKSLGRIRFCCLSESIKSWWKRVIILFPLPHSTVAKLRLKYILDHRPSTTSTKTCLVIPDCGDFKSGSSEIFVLLWLRWRGSRESKRTKTLFQIFILIQ